MSSCRSPPASTTSVAATKSFIASLGAVLRLVAGWAGDRRLGAAIARSPGRVAAAGELAWGSAVEPLAAANSAITIGRGPTLAIAREASLKLKETANLPSEAFSSAEFRHGPMALIEAGFPVLLLTSADVAAAGQRGLANDLANRGATMLAAPGTLPVLPADHPAIDAVCLVQSFYAMLPALAARRGSDAERPRHL